MEMMANHPFARRQLNARDEWGREGCAICSRPRGAHREPERDAEIAKLRRSLAELEGKP